MTNFYNSNYIENQDTTLEGKGCFPAGTLVRTKEGSTPIEKVAKDDLVLAYNRSGELFYGRVAVTHIHDKAETEDLYTFTVLRNGKELVLPKMTANHAVYDRLTNEHLQAKEFAIGDNLTDIHGITAPIVHIDIQHHGLLPEDHKVYNFEVFPHHTYHIGTSEFWLRVHNGGGSKGGARQPWEAPNTLQSKAIVKVLEVLGEGEIEGLVGDGLKGVYLNQIPVENEDGTFNFKDVTGSFRVGAVDQPAIPGFEDVASIFQSNSIIEKNNDVVQTIYGTNVTEITVSINISAGLYIENIVGDLVRNTVGFEIWVQRTTPTVGAWELVLSKVLEGKTVTSYDVDYRVIGPTNTSEDDQWQFKVVRVSSDDNPADKEASTIYLARWTEIQPQDPPLTYPDTALAGLVIPASEVGNQIPTRGYLLRGLKIPIPSNYDPVTRIYTGIWDGAAKVGAFWTNNNAWVLYDIIYNKRYGLGEFLGADIKIDKWAFYDAAVYCDGLIDNGYGVLEPRFMFDGVIQLRVDTWQLLQTIASSMRAVVITNDLGEISLIQDRPTESYKIFTNANVIEGIFTYASTRITERATSVNVTFNDREDRYLPRTVSEPTESDTLGNAVIDKYGFNLVDIVAYGTTREGQARRLAKWLLYTQNNEIDTVSFSVGLNILGVVIGDVVSVMDNNNVTADNSTFFGGRLITISGDRLTLTLDSPIDFSETNFNVSVMDADYSAIYTETTQTTGLTDTVVLDSPLPVGDYVLHEFVCWKTGVVDATNYRVVSITESEDGTFVLSGTFYDPLKWAYVEAGLILPPRDYVIWKPLPPVTGLAVSEDDRNDDVLATNLIRLYWDYNSKHTSYEIRIDMDGGKENIIYTSEMFVEWENIPVGTYNISIIALGLGKDRSVAATLQYSYGSGASNLLPPSNFQVSGGGTVFNAESVAFTWEYNTANDDFLGSLKDYFVTIHTADGLTKIGELAMPYDIDTSSSFYKGGQQVYSKEAIIEGFGSPVRSFLLKLYSRDLLGRLSATSTDIVATNPAPALPAAGSTVTGFGRDIIVTLGAGSVVPDISELLIASSDTTGFSPTAATWTWNVLASAAVDGVAIRSAAEGTYYIMFAISDTYNNTELNWTVEYTIIIEDGEDVIIFPTPGTPTGLAVSQETVRISASGAIVVKNTVYWTAVADPTSTYTVAYRNITIGQTLFDTLDSSETRLELPVFEEDITYEVKVRANYGDSHSPYSSPLVSFITNIDQTAPTPPNNFSVTDNRAVVDMTWDLPPERDYDHVELVYSATTDFPFFTDINDDISFAHSTGNSFTLGDIAPGVTGYLWARSVDTTGNKSNYVPPYDDPGEPGSTELFATPGAVTWASGTGWVVQDTTLDTYGNLVLQAIVSWTPPAESVSDYTFSWKDVTTTSGKEGLDIWTDIKVTSPTVSVPITAIGRSIQVKVIANYGTSPSVESAPATDTFVTTKDTTAPEPSTTLTASDGIDLVTLEWDIPIAEDYDKTLIYYSATQGSIPAENTDLWSIRGSIISIGPYPAGLIGYFWVRHIDTSGNISTPFPNNTNGETGSTSGVTFAAPDTPTWPTTWLDQDTTIDTYGNLVLQAIVYWQSLTGVTPTGYSFSWRDTTGGVTSVWTDLLTSGPTISVPIGAIGRNIDVKVKALNGTAESAESTVKSFTTTKDTTAPTIPAGLTASNGIDLVTLNWTASTADDYKHTEVYYSATDTTIPATPVDIIAGTTVQYGPLDPGLEGWFWIKHVDRSDNVSTAFPSSGSGIHGSTSGVDYGDVLNPPAPEGAKEDPSITFISRPGGAMGTFNGASTGAIKITLPTKNEGSIIKFTVDLFQYNGASFSLKVSGQNGGGTSWNWTKVELTGNTTSDNAVRFGYDTSGYACIWIAEVTTSWNYVALAVRDLQIIWSNRTVAAWATGWSITQVTSFDTVSRTLTDNLIDSKFSNNLVGQGDLATLDVVTANEINVATLSAIEANMGTITAGDLRTNGYIRCEGYYTTPEGRAAITGNLLITNVHGVQPIGVAGYAGTTGGIGVLGNDTTSGGGTGLQGSSTNGDGLFAQSATSSGYAAKLYNGASGGYALYVWAGKTKLEGQLELRGGLTTNSTSVVTNLNADRVDSMHAVYSDTLAFIPFVNTSRGSMDIGAILDFNASVGDYDVRLTATSAGLLTTSGAFTITGNGKVNGTTTITSDRRLKSNITPIDNALATIANLRGVTFNKKGCEGVQYGFIAQEVQEVVSSLVVEEEGEYLALKDTQIIGILVEAVKELKQQIEELKNERNN